MTKLKQKKIRNFLFRTFMIGDEERELSFKDAKERINSGEKIIAGGEIILNKESTRIRTAEITDIKFVKNAVHLVTNQMIYQVAV